MQNLCNNLGNDFLSKVQAIKHNKNAFEAFTD